MRFPSLAAWLDWQGGLNPRSIDLGLDRVRTVWRALGSPSVDAPVITIAGTNGKGSSVAFCESILTRAGYRCGCYTSPHLQRYNERIRIDGTAASDALICDAFGQIDAARGDVPLTYFEFGTLAALLIFAQTGLDAVVLEVGLGGRLDAVNLIDADVALICSIGLDHQSWLGTDRESIGREKAGIMRTGRPAVFSGRDIPQSIHDVATETGSRLLVAGEDYRIQRHAGCWDLILGSRSWQRLPDPRLSGEFQIDNAAGVIVALESLADRLPVERAALDAGLSGARLPGRFDVRPGAPIWVMDVAHNPQAAMALGVLLEGLKVSGQRIAVVGMLDDKDVEAVVTVLGDRFDRWLTIDLSDQPRGMSATTLAARVSSVLTDGRVAAAGELCPLFRELMSTCSEGDLVVAFGSFLTVAAALECLDGDKAVSQV